MRHKILILIVMVFALVGSAPQSVKADLPKLVVSSDGHYIETASGEPFMWISETLWYMVQRTTREDVEFLLDRLAGITNPNLGGTTVVKTTIAMKLGGAYASGDLQNPINAYGHQAFNGGNIPNFNSPKVVAGGGPDNPNDYWDYLDFIVRETKERGLYLTLTPQWSDSYVNGRYSTNKTVDVDTARSYGEWLGNRYRNENHIIWMLGGDGWDPGIKGTKHIYRAQAEGILKGVTGCINCPAYNEDSPLWDEVMMSYHGYGCSRASQYWDYNEKWMNLDGVYSGRFPVIADAYNQPNPRPVVETEGYGYWSCTEEQIGRQRAHHYGHYLSGGKGPEYMNEYIWNFEDGWKEWLSISERVQITIMKSIMSSVAWHKLVPDQEIILSPNSFSDEDFLKTIIASRSSDGDLIMAFFSVFSTGSAVIDLGDIASHSCVRGTWINPIDGTTQDAGEYRTLETPLFTIPNTWEDAMLKLEGVSESYLIPQTNWTRLYVDSEELVSKDQRGEYAFDGDINTSWHTEWLVNNPAAVLPHEIQINLGAAYNVSAFRYLPRTDGGNGNIGDYEFYVSNDTTNWGPAVIRGTFPNDTSEQKVSFNSKVGRYIRLRALSELNSKEVTVIRELNLLGAPAPETITGDLNNDNQVNIQDIQACGNVILGVETDPEVIQRAKEVTEPQGECNVLDVQAIVNIILGV